MIASKRLAKNSILRSPQRFSGRGTTRKVNFDRYDHSKGVGRNTRRNSFLTEGYQPTARELLTFNEFGYDRLECRQGFKEDRILPVLDASVVL